MVGIGSGGVITDADYILNELPYAQGLQYEQIFWNRHHFATLSKTVGVKNDMTV